MSVTAVRVLPRPQASARTPPYKGHCSYYIIQATAVTCQCLRAVGGTWKELTGANSASSSSSRERPRLATATGNNGALPET
jgi:hypothetical protein